MDVAAKPRLSISLCYIVKNEAEFLEASIRSAVEFVNELIIIDTGSTDSSRQIAEKFRKQVPKFQFEEIAWADDFSKARNIAASKAQEPWIFFLDGDEVLDPQAYEVLNRAIRVKDIACYSIIQRNYTWVEDTEGARAVSENPPGLAPSPRPLFYFENLMERLYQPGTGIAYEGRIHESLLPSVRRLHLKHKNLQVVLHHYGRLKSNAAKKIEYYLNLVEKKCAEEPMNAAGFIEWIITLCEAQQFAKAFQIAQNSIPKFLSEPEILKAGFHAALRAEQYAAAEAWITTYLDLRPQDLEVQAHLTTALLYQKKFDAVLHLANEILKKVPDSFVCHVNLAVIYFENQDWKKSKDHLEHALKEKPHDSFLNEALTKVRSKIQRD